MSRSNEKIILIVTFTAITFVFCCIAEAVAADVNWASTGTPSNSLTYGTPGGSDYFGYGNGWIDYPSRLIDGNTDQPAVGIANYTGSTAYFQFTSTIWFDSPHKINRIEVVYRGIAHPSGNWLRAWVYSNGWIEAGNNAGTYNCYSIYGDGMAYWQTYTFSIGGPWTNVTGVYINAYGYVIGQGWGQPSGYVSEIRAYGPSHVSGYVRYGSDGTGINGATVTVRDSGNNVVGTDITETKGSNLGWYEIELGTGDYTVTASYLDCPFDVLPFTISNSERDNANLYTYIIKGYIKRYDTDTGINGIDVKIKKGDTVIDTIRTPSPGGEDGYYEKKVPGGTYTIEAENP